MDKRVYHGEHGGEYVGDFRAGIRCGNGRLTCTTRDSSESLYEGEWVDDLRHGRGKIQYKNGNVYEGEFRSGERHGQCVFTNVAANTVYTGNFEKNNYFSGHGKMIFHNTGNIYEGEWRNNKMQGFGVMLYATGDKYEGEWSDSSTNPNSDRTGKGKYTKANGTVKFEGNWVDGKPDRH